MRCNSSIFKAENYTIEHNMGNFDGKNVVYIWYLHCREECQILKPNKTFPLLPVTAGQKDSFWMVKWFKQWMFTKLTNKSLQMATKFGRKIFNNLIQRWKNFALTNSFSTLINVFLMVFLESEESTLFVQL